MPSPAIGGPRSRPLPVLRPSGYAGPIPACVVGTGLAHAASRCVTGAVMQPLGSTGGAVEALQAAAELLGEADVEPAAALAAGLPGRHRLVQGSLLGERRDALGLGKVDAEQGAAGGVGAGPLRPSGAQTAAQDRNRALVATGAEAHVP